MDDEDITLAESGAEDQLKKLRERLKVCQKEKGEYLDGWQRSKADFINARRDEEKRIESATRYAQSKVLSEFLTLLDFIDMAQQHKEFEDLNGIGKQISDIFKKQGVEPIECISQMFNPERHEALMQESVESEDKDHRVIEELQKGYMMGDRVLRPSKVKVGIYTEKE